MKTNIISHCLLALLCLSIGLSAQIAVPAPDPIPRPAQSKSIALTAAQTTTIQTKLTNALTLPSGTTLIGFSWQLDPNGTTSTMSPVIQSTTPVTTQ